MEKSNESNKTNDSIPTNLRHVMLRFQQIFDQKVRQGFLTGRWTPALQSIENNIYFVIIFSRISFSMWNPLYLFSADASGRIYVWATKDIVEKPSFSLLSAKS